MPNKNKYFSLYESGEVADVYIFGDIVSWVWEENDTSSYTLSRQLAGLPSTVTEINVHINSYGGEVAEGLAIYNTLRSSKAKIRTICDGFGCSIASVIFMAGSERIMRPASMLMVHNAWMRTVGTSEELRKAADDLDAIGAASVAAYMSGVTIDEAELLAMLDAETWISPDTAVEKGFATAVEDAAAIAEKFAANARTAVMERMLAPVAKETDEQPALLVTGQGAGLVCFYDRSLAEQYVKQLAEPPEAATPAAEPLPTPTPPGVPENKTMRLFSALMGGKDNHEKS